MKATITGISGLIGIAYGVPAIAYVIGPAIKKDQGDWIQLGSVSKVEINKPTLFKTVVETQTGWIKSEEEVSAYVLTEDGQNYVALSNVCTHLGCRVRWLEDQDQFYCPWVVPGDSNASPLIRLLQATLGFMPPSGNLPEEEIQIFIDWINAGALEN